MSSNCVLVHARRTDYLTNSEYHCVLESEYYEQAKRIIQEKIENPKFILISDDMSFWKDSALFTKEESVYLDESDIDTFYVMIHSKSFIMANSSYSWWGAYLSNANLVIAPKQWYSENAQKVGDDIIKESSKMKGVRCMIELKVQNRAAEIYLLPTSSALLIKELGVKLILGSGS